MREIVGPKAVEHCKRMLSEHAARLNTCIQTPNARVMLNPMCDALVWSDEKPVGHDSFEFNRFFNAMLVFRSKQIAQPGEYDFDEVLYYARKVAPQWSFNRPERCQVELLGTLETLRAETEQAFKHLADSACTRENSND